MHEHPAQAGVGHDVDTVVASFITTPTPPLTGPVLSNLLLGEDEFTEPVHLLRDLTGEQACTKPDGAPETIAQVVSHMSFWQHRNLAVILGERPYYPATDAEKDATWTDVRPENWGSLVSDFLTDLDTLIGITENDQELARDLGADETVADRIRWSAVHNAYHFGQVALLRRIQGAWPPEGGENTY